ncbi:MAG: translocation/assembly module TamB [Bacteroides sp.]|nr:translocation/assembly module TamB [Roseburia sp.]MCM1345680.1 translocation/assembly module TamB [Bacteroides sp.]MCM1420437.1 translocation/assembly module TamB [Bacteroides sp.]
MDKEKEKEKVKNALVKNVKKNKVAKVAAWIALSPVLLFVLLSVLIYIPSVQQFTIDYAARYLSQETGMDVRVGQIRLKFPLDLSMERTIAIQGKDTVISADRLDVSIKMLPLLHNQIEVDGILLQKLKVNTTNLIEACHIKGEIGEFCLNAHNIDLNKGVAVVNKTVLKNTDLNITLADSTTKDTTDSQPALWKIDLCDIHLHQVNVNLNLAPNADSVSVGANIGNARIKAFIDLEKEIYKVDKLHINSSSVRYDVETNPYTDSVSHQTVSFDPTHILLSDFNMAIDSVEYQGTGTLKAHITQVTGKERCGLQFVQTKGSMEMKDNALIIPDLSLITGDSQLRIQMKMDMNTFDEQTPGLMNVRTSAFIGKQDLMCFLPDVTSDFVRHWPVKPVSVLLEAKGNMQKMVVDKLEAKLDGCFDIKSHAELTNVTDSLRIGGFINMRTKIHNTNCIRSFIPADIMQSFALPAYMNLDATAKINDGYATLDTDLSTSYGSAILTADYNIQKEEYQLGVDIEEFLVSGLLRMEQELLIDGSVTANGHGVDIYSPKTNANAIVTLNKAHLGEVDLSKSYANATISSNKILVNCICDNKTINTVFNLEGHLYPNNVDGTLDIDLPFADLYALGFSKDRLEVTTKGKASFTSNLSNKFMFDSHINGLDMIIGKDSVRTEDFDIFAETTSDSTFATLHTGDWDFDFHSPYNLYSLIAKGEKLTAVVKKQIDKKELDLEHLKEYMPVTTLETSIGRKNPLTRILAAKGISFNEMKAQLSTSPELGLLGNAHMYGFTNDTVKVDTVYFNISQDSTSILFYSGLICNDQKLCPGFKTYIDGHVNLDDANVHLTYLNKKGNKGIDIGVAAEFTDSLLHLNLYPEEPIIAFTRFTINKDNFVDLDKNGLLSANIKLASMSDSCRINLTATAEERQEATAIVENLKIDELLTVFPFMPKMGGMLDIDATYRTTEENFSINGYLSVDKYSFENMPIGDIRADFDYAPQGTTAHIITAKLSHNKQEVVTLDGTYDSQAKGSLDGTIVFDNLPLSIASPFVAEQTIVLDGHIGGQIHAIGPMDKLAFDGQLIPEGMTAESDVYAVKFKFADDPILIADSRLSFDKYKVYAAGENPLTLNGYVDFANMEQIRLSLGLYGRNFQLVDAQRTRKSLLFGKVYGDFFTRVTGTTDDLSVRGFVNILNNTDMTYIMADTPLSIDNRLDDIVTFVDFTLPPEEAKDIPKKSFMGIDMQVQLTVEDGAQFHCEFSADKQSYVNIEGGGSLTMDYTPEGVLTLQGRYTVNEGEMKYSLPIIPLKTFTIRKGSYIEFTGNPMNPVLNFEAYEQTKASVNETDGSSRTVSFDVGLKVANTLDNMSLDFTIDAPEDIRIQNELAGMSKEEKNKLAIAMLATGMYLSGNNSSGFNASNALNNFLQGEINNIAGKALSTAVDVNVGMEQNTNYDGSTRTDYSFRFSKRFFSNRLNVVIGGKVSDDKSSVEHESGAYIDDVSLEWRLDKGGTRYIRIFHEKNYDNLLEGELIENGVGIVLRKKMDKLSELFIFKNSKKNKETAIRKPTGNNLPVKESGNTSDNPNREASPNSEKETKK